MNTRLPSLIETDSFRPSLLDFDSHHLLNWYTLICEN
jgi:hypothetical protein